MKLAMKTLPILQPGDHVDIIAPASRCDNKRIAAIKNALSDWQLNFKLDDAMFGDDLLCAHNDDVRARYLTNALKRPDTKAIFCVRGGYGSMRLIDELAKLKPQAYPKIIVGMSDITAINLYLENHWQWPVIHSALAPDIFSDESMHALKSVLFGEVKEVEFAATPLNEIAKNQKTIVGTITGGNLCLVQTSIGTTWQMNPTNKIIFLEEIGERGYRVDRMLEHLRQAGLFKGAKGIVFGDFIDGNEPDGTSLVQRVLERFAAHSDIPVVQIKGVGHGHVNMPLPLGSKATLFLGAKSQLICER